MTYKELETAVKEKKVLSATTKDKEKYRFFIADNGLLCYFKKGSSRYGRYVDYNLFETFEKFQYKKALTEDEKKNEHDKRYFRLISKFRNLASKATFKNNFIDSCLALPQTMEQWINEGRKTLFDYNVGAGSRCEGLVITVDNIAKHFPHTGIQLKEAIKNRTAGNIMSRMNFRGYDATIDLRVGNEQFEGFLSMEYKGCGNGHYYILINDNTFIGYDTD